MKRVFLAAITPLLVCPAACSKKESSGPGSGDPLGLDDPNQPLPMVADAPRHPAKPGTDRGVALAQADPGPFSGAHILIAYQGAQRAKPEITRSKEAAKKEAERLAAVLKKNPAAFAELSRKHSDGPSGKWGGDLGTWMRGKMVPAFQQAIDSLKIGEISSPVETPFGFHVMFRLRPVPTVEVSAEQLVVAYKGATKAKDTVKRTREQAQALAKRYQKLARQKPEKFPELVKKHSDGEGKDQGGRMGTWWTSSRRVPAVFSRVLAELKVGEISVPVETPFGFHLLRRIKLPPILAGSHILVSFVEKKLRGVTRTRQEAETRAAQAATEARKSPDKFAELVQKYSDSPRGHDGKPGSLGAWRQGSMLPEVEKALLKLKVGEVSDPVETKYGFHVVKREKAPDKLPEPRMRRPRRVRLPRGVMPGRGRRMPIRRRAP